MFTCKFTVYLHVGIKSFDIEGWVVGVGNGGAFNEIFGDTHKLKKKITTTCPYDLIIHKFENTFGKYNVT